jgi:hypothetical protein
MYTSSDPRPGNVVHDLGTRGHFRYHHVKSLSQIAYHVPRPYRSGNFVTMTQCIMLKSTSTRKKLSLVDYVKIRGV